jgi:hypothetical protein
MPQQNYLQPNHFFRREHQHVEEEIYQNEREFRISMKEKKEMRIQVIANPQ